MGMNNNPQTPRPPLSSYPVAHVRPRYTDPEVEFAARLVQVLDEMRDQLDPVAVKRVLTFAMERCGIQVILGIGLAIGTMPLYEVPEIPPYDDGPDNSM